MFKKIIYGLAILCILIIVGFVVSKFQGCGFPQENTTVITPLKTVTPTDEDKRIVGPGKEAIGVIKPKDATKRNNKWTKTDTKIIIAADSKCNTCLSYIQVDKTKTFLGFDFEPKIYLGYTNTGFTLGYDQGIFRYGKTSLDLLISFPTIGAGLSYNLTNNFFILGGALVPYVGYNTYEDTNSYKFGISNQVGGLAAAGFCF